MELFLVEILNYLVTESIVTNSTDSKGLQTKLTNVVGKVCRCTTYLSSFRKAVP